MIGATSQEGWLLPPFEEDEPPLEEAPPAEDEPPLEEAPPEELDEPPTDVARLPPGLPVLPELLEQATHATATMERK
jgi:hypothetical protein